MIHRYGERGKGVLRPDFNRSAMMDFQGARLSSDSGFLLLTKIDQRFEILGDIGKPLNVRVPLPTPGTLWFR